MENKKLEKLVLNKENNRICNESFEEIYKGKHRIEEFVQNDRYAVWQESFYCDDFWGTGRYLCETVYVLNKKNGEIKKLYEVESGEKDYKQYLEKYIDSLGLKGNELTIGIHEYEGKWWEEKFKLE